ncbi:MAG: terminase small subunit [Pseudomonadota bacterium]
MPARSLTAKQQAFVDHYVKHRSASDAYRHAYDAGKMSPTAVANEAGRLLRNQYVAPIIQDALDAAREAVAARHEVTLETVTAMQLVAAVLARSQAKPEAISKAADSLAKLHGLIVDLRRDVTPRTPRETDAELRELLADEEAAAPDGAATGAQEAAGSEETVPTVSGHGTA